MRKMTALVIGLIFIALNLQSTEINPGPVYGDWYSFMNPFNINGEIYVPTNQTLFIHDNVQVIFQGYYKFIVYGCLFSIGTKTDSVYLISSNSEIGWHGMHFINASDSSEMNFCSIKFANGDGTGNQGDLGGGLYIENSDITVSNCTIDSCEATNGGAIYIIDANPIIMGNKLSKNIANSSGGAICLWNSSPYIINNLIYENNANNAGGIVCFYYSNPIITFNTITLNISGTGGAVWSQSESHPIIDNCIIFFNLNQQVAGLMDISYSDIQGGFTGTGIIDENPLFTIGELGSYYLSQTSSGQTNESPCVNAGNPDSVIYGTTRTNNIQDDGIADIGYHYTYEVITNSVHKYTKPALSSFKLHSPSPNPFNASTSITFDLPDIRGVELIIYDISGREVWRLASDNLHLGTNEVVWDTEGMPSGLYFARLSAGEFNQTQKLLLLK